MSNVVDYIEQVKPPAMAGAFVLLLVFEALFPLRRRKAPFPHRIVVNLVMTALTFLAGAFVVKTAVMYLIGWTSERPFGLLHAVALPFPVQFAIGFVFMDVTFYYWHRLNHTVPWLWRFHNPHHIDPDLDVSTAFRFHFVEILYSTVFRALQITLLGIASLTFVIYELLFQWGTIFHHSNLRIPIRVERWLNKVIVTPRMHGIHHSTVKGETNSNYSVIFKWWDMLHHSLRLNIPQENVVVGVPNYLQPQDNHLWNVLALPFRKQRNYWRMPDGTVPQRRPTEAVAGANVLQE